MANDIYFSDPGASRPPSPPPAPSRPPERQNSGRRNASPAKPAAQPESAPARRTAPPRRKKRRPVLRFFLILFLLIAAAAAAAGAYGVHTYRDIMAAYSPVPMQKSGVVDEASLMHRDDVYNILLMGVDLADTDSATRSDSMILLSVDKTNRRLKLTTFMRDMYVTVPGYGDTKLTHACMYEGPQLTVDTIELNFGVRIDAYAKIGYDIFIELVNGVGGITVAEIDETEARALAEEGVYVDPGTDIHLTGEQAIKYVRIRHWQSDFARTERQREAITLIIGQAKKTPLRQLVALAKSLAGKVVCTVPKEDILPLAAGVLPCLQNGIDQQQIPADGTWEDGIRDSLMVLLVDRDANREIIRNFIYGGSVK